MARVNYTELNKAIKPMRRNTVKSIERNSARYIFVNKDRLAKCERCESEFTLAGSKHLSYCKCPSCKRTLQVVHSWRKSSAEVTHWEVSAKALNESILVLRYYLVRRQNGNIIESRESARLFINASTMKTEKFELSIWDADWRKGGFRFFREYGMGYRRNSLCCLDAGIRKNVFTEAHKLDALKYIDINSIFCKSFYASSICYYIKDASLYEKLQKVGMNDLIISNMRTYSDYEMIKYDSKQTELSKMLGISRNSIAMLKSNQNLNALRLLQKFNDISQRDFEVFSNFTEYQLDSISKIAERISVTTYKVAKYILEQGISNVELERHHRLMVSMGYNLKDYSYSMPRDFHKENDRLTTEYNAKRKREQDELNAKKEQLIKAISEKISSTKELREFFNGSKGFMAYIPMSEEEFVEEGKNQHNCVGMGTYAERVAKGETLVVFIRELDNPQASFVTMEYCNGAIVQCMLDRNERVGHDTEVYSFAEALANRLNECNILSA